MQCSNCGAKVDSADKFCKGCGVKISKPTHSTDIKAPSGPTKPVAKSPSNTNTVAIAIVIFVILAIGVIFLAGFSGGGRPTLGFSSVNLPSVTDVQAARAEKFLKSQGSSDENLKAIAYCVSEYYDGLNIGDGVALGQAQDCITKSTNNKIFCSDAADGSGPVCSELGKHVGYSISKVWGTMMGQDTSSDSTSGQGSQSDNGSVSTPDASDISFSLIQSGDVTDTNGCYGLSSGEYQCAFTVKLSNGGKYDWLGTISPKLTTNTGVKIASSGSAALMDNTTDHRVALADSFTSLLPAGGEIEWGMSFTVKAGLRLGAIQFYDSQGKAFFLPLCFTTIGDDGAGNKC